MTDWRPIDSAPRDGNEILLWDPDRAVDSRMQIGLWNDIWETPGWQSCMENEALTRPTHWMPLPDPPGAAMAAEKPDCPRCGGPTKTREIPMKGWTGIGDYCLRCGWPDGKLGVIEAATNCEEGRGG